MTTLPSSDNLENMGSQKRPISVEEGDGTFSQNHTQEKEGGEINFNFREEDRQMKRVKVDYRKDQNDKVYLKIFDQDPVIINDRYK